MDINLNQVPENMRQVADLTRCALTTLLLIRNFDDEATQELIDDVGKALVEAWTISSEFVAEHNPET